MDGGGRAQYRSSAATANGANGAAGDHHASKLMIKAKRGWTSGTWPAGGAGKWSQQASALGFWRSMCATLAVALLVVIYGHPYCATHEPSAVKAAVQAAVNAQQPGAAAPQQPCARQSVVQAEGEPAPSAPAPSPAAAAPHTPAAAAAAATEAQDAPANANANATARPPPRSRRCVGWRTTMWCSPFGEREPAKDLGCDTVIHPIQSGYCLCEGGVTTARSSCGPKPMFTCRGKCAELGLDNSDELTLPQPIGCPYKPSYKAEDFLEGAAKLGADPPGWKVKGEEEAAKVAKVWYSIYKLAHDHGVPNATAPGVRNDTHDFVNAGIMIPKATVQWVRSQLAAYKHALPEYPSAAYSGRGIVTVGGGLKYIVPVWLLVHRLRFTGCTLPIEVWFPVSDWPTDDFIRAFKKLGATPRKFEFVGLNIYLGDAGAAWGGQGPRPDSTLRFTFKVAALTLSRFQEIIYLDADNIPLRDPSFLFNLSEYRATGALFWQDYWLNTVAPQAAQMLNISRDDPSQWFKGSFESGQMVVDKRRHWRGLLLAVWVNTYSHFWYEILSCHIGKGDKESFAYSMAAAGERYSVIQTPPGSVGLEGTTTQCNGDTNRCRYPFNGNSMLQYDTEDNPLFLHANINKISMRVPSDFKTHYVRRWQLLYPGRKDWEQWSKDNLGYDLELQIYDWIRRLRCAPWWDDYVAERSMRGDVQRPYLGDSLHNIVNGVDFSAFYGGRWYGVYTQIFSSWDKARWSIGARRLLGHPAH